MFYKVYNDTVISYFELEKTSLTDIVDIFIRVNNGGTNLTKTEMLMSVVTSVWRDGRSKIDKFLKKINNNGEFDFDVDFIMRASLFIMDKDGKQWNVNETLISEGHAYVYDGGKKKLFKG